MSNPKIILQKLISTTDESDGSGGTLTVIETVAEEIDLIDVE